MNTFNRNLGNRNLGNRNLGDRKPLLGSTVRRFTQLACLAVIAVSVGACANKDGKGTGENLLGPNGGLNGGKGNATPGSQRDFAQNVGDIVYFSSDATDLTPEAQTTLTTQARWLQQYAQYTITIEGHADERGTREYNIALGAKRAQSVRDFLVRTGVSAQRVRTVSFGKERPVEVCNDIQCWSKNRRAQTVLNNRTAQN
jgi:peptidoglycan-associated lipoprotein